MDQLGYFKIDILNVNLYSQIKSRDHLQELFDREPPWHRLDDKTFVDQLFHLNGHSNTVAKLMPANLEQLAATLAVIRPHRRIIAFCSDNNMFVLYCLMFHYVCI